jgi:glycosyltransferase involved in cell wall biosynthesis
MFSEKNPLLRSTLSKCDLVLFANLETQQLLGKWCSRQVGQMIDVGVDPNRFRGKGEGGGNEILFAGRFEARKGTRLLLMAFQEALRENPELRLRMVGDGKQLELEREWVKSQGLGHAVVLVGRLSHLEMAEAFASAGIFAFPSLRDTSGAIVLEAMASKVPTVCLDHQGASLMVDEDSGIRVPVKAREETIRLFARALIQLSGDPGLRRSMGENARKRVLKEFSWERKGRKMLDHYLRLQEPGQS